MVFLRLASLVSVSFFLAGCSFKPNLDAIRAQLDPYPAPVLTSVSPNVVMTGGGATITISGLNYMDGALVTLDDSPCIPLGTASSTSLSCAVPPHSAGTATVQITNPDGQSLASPGSIQYTLDGFSEMQLVAGNKIVQGSADGVYYTASFSWIQGIAELGSSLYVADNLNSLLRKIDLSSGLVTTLAGEVGSSTSGNLSTGNNASHPKGIINRPIGMATDGTYLYTVSEDDNVIMKFDPAAQTLSIVAGRAGVTGSSDGAALSSSFSAAAGLTWYNGDLYIADSGNNSIRRLHNGTVSTVAKQGCATPATCGINASLNQPNSLVDLNGTLYVVNYGDSSVVAIDLVHNSTSILAGQVGQPPFIEGIDGPCSTAAFYSPYSIATDGTHLYVSDISTYQIRKITFDTNSCNVTTLIGQAPSLGSDVVGALSTKAAVTDPGALFYDPNLGLYVGTYFTVMRVF